jgi:hypothetical protein
MTSEQLPPLPEPFMELHREISPHVYAAWAEQMRAYAAAALAQEREACAKVCDEMAERDKLSNYYRIAANAIRARGQQQEPDDGNPSF